MAKARTKAAKIKAKRGRPRKQGAQRTESGRLSRSFNAQKSEELLILETATWKRRQSDPDLTIDQARLPEHGSVIARWHQDWQKLQKRHPDGNHPNQFTRLHFDTAERYHRLYLDWLAVIGARAQRSASDFTRSGGHDGSDPFDESRASRHAAIERDFKAARRSILEAGPFCMMAVETIIVENQPAESLRGDLRLALNRLSILWKLQAAA